ncbi:MAG: PAS domain-containing protein [Deltaproteobacteria bacterium]|nr:PAS domain-containing protein [Deltaproteobacteria bacterium]
MTATEWIPEFPAAITVCDADGTIIAMNEASARVFAGDGGKDLVGRNALDCHPTAARERLAELLRTGRVNAYTIEKQGRRKLIYQAPWREGGELRGFVELSLELPDELPHFVRT